MGEYTYLIGLVIWGAILAVVGLIAAKRERNASNAPPDHRPATHHG